MLQTTSETNRHAQDTTRHHLTCTRHHQTCTRNHQTPPNTTRHAPDTNRHAPDTTRHAPDTTRQHQTPPDMLQTPPDTTRHHQTMSEVSRGSMMIYRAVQLIKIFSTGPSSLKMFRNFPRKKDFFSSLVLSSHMDMDGAQLPCTEQLGENWSWSGVRSFISSSELLRPCHRTDQPTNQPGRSPFASFSKTPQNLQCIS